MYVWLHSSSPPQHIANVEESAVITADKLRTYMTQTNERRLTNLKWAGVFEDQHGKLSVHMFWTIEKAHDFIARNDNPIISTEG